MVRRTRLTSKADKRFGDILLYLKEVRRLKIWMFDINTAGVIVLCFAIVEEFTQLAFASRSFDLLDMLSDVLGVWFFVFLSEWMWKRATNESGQKGLPNSKFQA